MPQLTTCTIDDCNNKHRARGYCSSHYNALVLDKAKRHGKYDIVCASCGSEYRSTRPSGTYCSLLCRDFARWGPRSSPWPRAVPTARTPKPAPFREERECAWCGHAFIATRRDRMYCTTKHKVKASKARRRSAEHGSQGTYTWAEVTKLWLLIGACCAYCHEPKRNDEIEPDHVEPLSRGGSNSITNVVPSCKLCNSDKRDLALDDWYLDRERRGLEPRRLHRLLRPVSVTLVA